MRNTIDKLNYFVDEYIVACTYYDLLLEIASIIKDKDGKLRTWYHTLWLFSLKAYTSSMFLAMYRFFDTHPKANQFRPLIEKTKNKDLLDRYDKLKTKWDKRYANFRHKYIAHLDASIKKENPNNVVALTTPTLDVLAGNELKTFFNNLHTLLADVSQEWKGGEQQKWTSYYQALDELKRVRRSLTADIERERGYSRR
jgi:hypothetical protein